MTETPYFRAQLSRLLGLVDAVDKDMHIYDITGVMDIEAQNAALAAMGPILDQLQAEVRTEP